MNVSDHGEVWQCTWLFWLCYSKIQKTNRKRRTNNANTWQITRYFMTISEASQLVIQAAAMAKGGEVFVLDMGEPVRIYDLAERMIELSGHKVRSQNNPDGDIEIETIGLRPGEKLYEELLIGETKISTSHSRIFKLHEDYLKLDDLKGSLAQLKVAILENDVLRSRQIISELVPEYMPMKQLVDWTYNDQ